MARSKLALASLIIGATFLVGWTPSAEATSCGNGVVNNEEACDDGNANETDGCLNNCTIQPGWACVGTNPSVCHLIVCGDEIVDAPEQCDGGACCSGSCTLLTSTCRAAAGVCDEAEVCDGTNADCPGDDKLTSVCRAAAGDCDAEEVCDGATNNCPADAKQPSTFECREVGGPCDPDGETCTGSTNTCPSDTFSPSTTVCREAAGSCDQAENCTGTSGTCPADAKKNTVCRAAVGECDLAESCGGSSNECPEDAKSTAVCRPAVNEICDNAESCNGTDDNCPDDILDGPCLDIDQDGIECTEATCMADGTCAVVENCVEICRGPGFWQTHSGYEKGANIGQEVINTGGPIEVCGLTIDSSDDNDLGSILETLCIRVQGIQERQLLRQLVTAYLNCQISEGGDCDDIFGRFSDIAIGECNNRCASGPINENTPTVEECIDALSCFNGGGRYENGVCSKGTCDDDGETLCEEDEDCDEGETCVRYEDSCALEDICTEDLETPADTCPQWHPASSPKACRDARKNGIAFFPFLN